jgi:hypothetical protein
MRVVKAAAVQLRLVLYSRDGTVDRVFRTIHTLRAVNCRAPSSEAVWLVSEDAASSKEDL